jgi:hypothetical protein
MEAIQLNVLATLDVMPRLGEQEHFLRVLVEKKCLVAVAVEEEVLAVM